jgi:hypothetical protein
MSSSDLGSYTSTILDALRKIYARIDEGFSDFSVSRRSVSADFFLPTGGQFQFSVSSPTWREPEQIKPGNRVSFPQRSGAVFVEAAPPIPNSDKLDWAERKIIFALNDTDVSQILDWLSFTGTDKLRIVHAPKDLNPSENSKTLVFEQKNDVLLELVERKNGAVKSKVFTYLKTHDLTRLSLFLRSAFPVMMGINKI